MAKGEKNLYRCEKCNEAVITVDTDDGTTPMMIRCRASVNCYGVMISSLYRNVPDSEPLFEWRKPTKSEYRRSSAAMQHHFDMGGLDLYPLMRAGKLLC